MFIRVLLIAPGKSLINERDKIQDFIKKHKPYVITLNFSSDMFKQNMVFVTNLKRYNLLKEIDGTLVVTSNVQTTKTKNILNYTSYINNSTEFDNTALMILKLLVSLKIDKVHFAGLDGFSSKLSENYVSEELLNTINFKELSKRNNIIAEQLNSFRKYIEISFITKSIYEKKEEIFLL